jgi:drug/metabolite transporter (DMT)-like permease
MTLDAQSKTPTLTLHITVLIWAATALFAKLIPLPAANIIYLRSIPAFLALTLTVVLFRISFRIPLTSWFVGLFIGLLTAGHWVTFYKSVQLSTVAIGLVTLYTYPLLTALVEPMLHKQWPQRKPLLLSIFGLLGVVFMSWGSLNSQASIVAILLGLSSSLFFTVRNVSSKYLAANIPSLLQMWIQVLTTLIVLMIALGFSPIMQASTNNWLMLTLLGIVFVALPHTLFLYCLKHIKASSASLMSMIQPVYAIVLAIIVLGEIPSLYEIAGGAIILITATLATMETTR